MAKMKSRKQHMEEYAEKYQDIPVSYGDRIKYIDRKFKIKNINKLNIERELLLQHRKEYKEMSFILYEIPQTSHRGKARTFSKNNKLMTQIYVPNAKANKNYMTDFINHTYDNLKLICTEMEMEIKFYLPTPISYPNSHIRLCEEELIRPIIKPDVDNVSKAYMDMCSSNVFLDDALVTDIIIRKRYSIKPRVEINIKYYDKIPTKNIFRAITNSSFFKNNKERFELPDIVLSENIRRK